MFENLKLRGRLLLGYTFPCIFFVGLALLVYTNIRQVFNLFKEIDRVQNLLINIYKTDKSAMGIVSSYRGYVAFQNPVVLQEYESYLQQFNTQVILLNELLIHPEQKERLAQIRGLMNEYVQVNSQALRLVQQGQTPEAITLTQNRNTTLLVQEIEQLSQAIAKKEEEILAAETEGILKNLTWLIYALIFGTFLSLILAIFLAILISENISKTIQRTTQAIAISSTEIATTLEEQERSANQQAAAVNETTTTMNELSTSSRSTAEQAESAVSDAKQALNLTENGSKAVEKTLEGMANLQEKVDGIAQQIIRLSEQTNQIGNISKLVSDLANQTNMLALNAAVEAVRAGEHGKGFAVVAAEIRKLSDESQKSAQRINTLVTDIQNAINSTVLVTEEGSKTVLSGVEIAQLTASALIGVSDAVNNVVLNNQQISLNTQQQAIAIAQVLEAMNSINQGTNETANGLNQTKTGLQKLNQVALELQSSM